MVANTVTPPRVFTEVRKMACSYIWSDKKCKIAYCTLIQAIKDGGLRLVDLETRTQLAWLSWIRRAINKPTESTAETLRDLLQIQDLSHILATKPTFDRSLTKQAPFYAQVLQCWNKLHNLPPTDEQDIRREVLWLNSRITLNGKVLSGPRWTHWRDKGITTLGQICHPQEDRLLDQEELEREFALRTNFLDCLALCSSIPFEWKSALMRDFQGDAQVTYEFKIGETRFDVIKLNQKNCYTALVTLKAPPNPRKDSWTRELASEVPSDPTPQIDWEQAFALPYKTSRETKIQAFQYRILQRIITCNKYLHKIRIKPSSTCSYCLMEDSLTHFLTMCPSVKIFWNQLNRWCEQHIDISLIQLSASEVILGLTRDIGTPKQRKMINWIVLNAKFFLHRQKLFHDGNISLIAFLNEARQKLVTERLACQTEGRPHKFQIWQKIYEALGA